MSATPGGAFFESEQEPCRVAEGLKQSTTVSVVEVVT
jgi:hypothetical protein